MKFENVVIESFATHLPDTVMTTEAIEEKLAPIYKRLRLPQGRLELMTGIKARRVWPRGTWPSDLSAKAANKLFDTSKFDKSDVDMLVHASVCRNFLEPSTASVIHDTLNLNPECTIFDLSNACLGVLNSFVVAASMIEAGTIKTALIVTGENGGPLLEETIDRLNKDETITRKSIKKFIANLTIGSAACAYLLCHKDMAPQGHKLLGGAVMTDSTANELCRGDGDPTSLMMETDSEALMQAGVVLAKKTWKKTRENLGWNHEDINWAIGHQVGQAHEKLTMETLELTKTPTFTTYETLGNTGSAALPTTLALMSENKEIKKGDKIALLGIGSGLSSIMLGVEW
jgi:3-oxoacyl-[acyl-carrier-protein] synthase-3